MPAGGVGPPMEVDGGHGDNRLPLQGVIAKGHKVSGRSTGGANEDGLPLVIVSLVQPQYYAPEGASPFCRSGSPEPSLAVSASVWAPG